MTATEPQQELVTRTMEMPREIQILGGLFPFKQEFFQMEEEPEAPPFLRLLAKDGDLAFHVLDPFLVLDDYAPDISDADSEVLDLNGPEETMLLNVVNLNKGAQEATINLVAPLVVNLRTRKAKQIILQNAQHYSVKHRLFG